MSDTPARVIKKYIPMSETAFYILLSLAPEPRHGYGIIKYVESITGGRLVLGSGTVYGSLTKMLKDHLILVYADEERKKTYEITDLGKKVLHTEMERLEELYHNAQAHKEGKS
ncbi:PadR family transcriptional regulator [Alkalicoccus chagannorensis]|uniref:PadR family transcriptional regulator n=1 Tax=Alkalicoccus chagannorensis TaxID=427072 RepID=UPI000403E7A4|nr:PadR family transcriptional regulator [Alkalicoccus chagannorensis]